MGPMKRRHFLTLFSGTMASLPAIWPWAARSQNQPPPNQPPPNQAPSNQAAAAATADNSIGQVATLSGTATVTRANTPQSALKVTDPIYEKDTVQTNVNSSLGITFDDQTTFNLSANTSIVIDEFVYKEGDSGNAASFNVATGTAAFVASLVAKTGDMKITTPQATLGIRGTTGIVDVPQGAGAALPTVKLYPDTDGHVGSIDVFDRQGGRLGALTQGSSAFALRAGPGGRIAAVPYQIPPLEAARDRVVLQRLNVSHNVGRQMTIQRQELRRRGGQQPNNQRPGGERQNNQRPGGERQNNQRPGGERPNNQRPDGQQPFNRPQRLPGQPRQRPSKEKKQ